MNDRDRVADHECDEVLSVLRHELGGALAVLDMMFETVGDHLGELPSEIAEIIAAGRRQLDVAQAILDDLHVAGNETAELQLDLETVDLRRVTERHIDDLTTTILRERDVGTDIPSEAVMVGLDVRRYGQLLRNLLENADKYTPKGSPVHVQIEGLDGHAEVRIADSGEGVAPQDADRIFHRYVRGVSGRGGIGIGLAISRQIARAHGGDLRVTDAPEGQGACFVLELPRSPSQANAA